MKFLSRLFFLLFILGFTSASNAANTVVLDENGQVTEEQSKSDDKKDSKGKEDKTNGEEEEPDCE